MNIEQQMQEHILKDCEKYYRKVARVWGMFLMKYEEEHGRVNYVFFENIFFKVLNELIEKNIIVPRGTISPDNMRYSEIGFKDAKH